MPDQDEYNEAFWLAYCDAVKGSWSPSSGTAMCFAQQGQLGPAAGSGIDERYTNYGVYQLADNLLSSDSLSYNPSESNSYSRELLKFVDNVDTGNASSAGHEAALDEMRQNQDPNQRALDRIKAKAMEDFQGAVDMGVAQPGSFENWAMMNAPQYFVALQQSRAGGAAFGQAQTQANGPKSDEYNRVRELLANAVNSGQPQAGVTMQAAVQSLSAAAAIRKAQQSGERAPDTQVIRGVPAYSAPEYSNMAKDSMATRAENVKWETQAISFQRGDGMNDSKFGQTAIREVSPRSIPTPWFGSSSGGGQSSAIDFVLTTEEQEKTDINVKWTDRRLININPGNWDIKGKEYKLKSSAPDSVKNLMRPTQLVCLSNLSYEIKLYGESSREVDRIISRDARLHIFGWTVGIEGRDSARAEETSHVAKWDKEKALLTVSPKLFGASVCVAAIVGEKVNAGGEPDSRDL